MTISDFLIANTRRLEAAGIGTARLDCLVLLEDCLNKSRVQILAHPEIVLSGVQLAKLKAQITQRAQHIPLAYLRGKTEFYGREFIINNSVLEPRPESETMIDLFLQLFAKHHSFKPTHTLKVLDVGTGSGALGITAGLELGLKQVYLLDIDATALEVARQNAAQLNQPATLLQNDLLSDVFKNNNVNFDVLLCNLPYVPDNFQINTAALHEPKLAIFGGADGLDLYRKLFLQLASGAQKPTYVLAESMPPQHSALSDIARAHSYTLEVEEDFIQVFTTT